MKKILKIDGTFSNEIVLNRRIYLYRVASVNIDKVTLEKHLVTLLDTLALAGLLDGKGGITTEMNDENKVGTVTQKMRVSLIADISKRVDEVAVDFEMDGKMIKSIDFKGVISV